jgi:hypothetical protein
MIFMIINTLITSFIVGLSIVDDCDVFLQWFYIKLASLITNYWLNNYYNYYVLF